MNTFGRITLAALLAAGLAACEGDDGQNGLNGADGSPGLGDVLLDLKLLGRYSSNKPNVSAAEIVAYDAASKRLFVVNAADASIDVLDLSNPAAPTKVNTITTTGGSSANSVAVHNNLVAVAIPAEGGAITETMRYWDGEIPGR